MKKIIITAFAACALLAACTEKESAPVQNNDVKVVFEIADKAGFGQDTKAVKTAWAEGDQILVIFKANDGVNQGQGFLTDDCEVNTLRFVYDGSAWDSRIIMSVIWHSWVLLDYTLRSIIVFSEKMT